jgi:hypothetical protein
VVRSAIPKFWRAFTTPVTSLVIAHAVEFGPSVVPNLEELLENFGILIVNRPG